MVSRTMWAEALDEDEPLAIEGLPSVASTGLRIEPDPVAASEPPADEAQLSDDTPPSDDARRLRIAAGWLLALVGLALLLLLGWWFASQGDDAVAAGPGSGTLQSAAANPSAGHRPGAVDGLRDVPGAGVPRADGVVADRGGTSDTSGILRQAKGGTGGTAASAAGAGSAAGGGASGSGAGAAKSPLISGKVDAAAGAAGVNAGADVSAAALGGAVATVVVTSCVRPGALSTALDTRATVTWANGYQATDVKLTGLNLVDLAHPVGLTIAPGGGPVAVPAGAKVQVGLCLGL